MVWRTKNTGAKYLFLLEIFYIGELKLVGSSSDLFYLAIKVFRFECLYAGHTFSILTQYLPLLIVLHPDPNIDTTYWAQSN